MLAYTVRTAFAGFRGLPEAKEIDGVAARQFQSNTQDAFYYNNATASREVFEEAMKISGCNNVQIHEGWFEDTLPQVRPIEGIGVLRLDGDWFDSTMTCLRELFPLVLPGGLIIVDDYLAFEECSKAVHRYLADEVRPEALRTWNSRVYYMIKSPKSESAFNNRGATASTAQ